MEAAKAAWVVTAGVLPGDPLKRYELALGYTSSDYEKDKATQQKNSRKLNASGGKLTTPEDTIFMKNCASALAHARDVMDPQFVNWVRVEFVWY